MGEVMTREMSNVTANGFTLYVSGEVVELFRQFEVLRGQSALAVR